MSHPDNPVFLYVVDTSFLIEIHKRYPEKTLPGIWKDLDALIREGRVIAPEYVRSEINRQDDELKDGIIMLHVSRIIRLIVPVRFFRQFCLF
jgi:hypothetical protein